MNDKLGEYAGENKPIVRFGCVHLTVTTGSVLKSQDPLLRGKGGKRRNSPLLVKIVNFQSISDLNGTIASLADFLQKYDKHFSK